MKTTLYVRFSIFLLEITVNKLICLFISSSKGSEEEKHSKLVPVGEDPGRLKKRLESSYARGWALPFPSSASIWTWMSLNADSRGGL